MFQGDGRAVEGHTLHRAIRHVADGEDDLLDELVGFHGTDRGAAEQHHRAAVLGVGRVGTGGVDHRCVVDRQDGDAYHRHRAVAASAVVHADRDAAGRGARLDSVGVAVGQVLYQGRGGGRVGIAGQGDDQCGAAGAAGVGADLNAVVFDRGAVDLDLVDTDALVADEQHVFADGTAAGDLHRQLAAVEIGRVGVADRRVTGSVEQCISAVFDVGDAVAIEAADHRQRREVLQACVDEKDFVFCRDGLSWGSIVHG